MLIWAEGCSSMERWDWHGLNQPIPIVNEDYVQTTVSFFLSDGFK